MRDTIVKMWKHKWIVIICIVVSAGIGALVGYKNGVKEQAELSGEYDKLVKSANTEYEANIANYDNNIKNIELEVEKAQLQIDSVSDFINNSVYMKLDPSNIHVQNAIIEVSPEVEDNVADEVSKLATYITSGAIYGELDESLDAKHWNDIVSVNTINNGISITILHTDETSAKNAMKAIIDAVTEYSPVPLIVTYNGHSIKNDVNVGYEQINHRNNYCTYEQNLNNQIKSLNDQENAKAAYEASGVNSIIDAKVEAEDKEYNVSPVKKALLASIIGALIGFLLPMCVFLVVGIINDDKKRNN